MSKNEEKKKKRKKHGFTLVELVVVITILAILGSIAFVSLQGYTAGARDGVRTADMKNISKGLALSFAKTGMYPIPEKVTILTASGIIIRYQGIAGPKMLNIAGITVSGQQGKDPKTGEYYTYIVDGKLIQANIAGYYERGSSLSYKNIVISKVNASYTGGYMKSIGPNLGMIYENEIPVHEKYQTGTTIDIKNTNTIYRVNFDANDDVIGTGATLFAAFYNRDRYLLPDKNLAILDDTLVGYWDMETVILSGSKLVLKDFSNNKINGACYDGGTPVDCGVSGPLIGNGHMTFDGYNDFVEINKNVYSDSMTVLIKIKPMVFDGNRHGVFGYQGAGGFRPLNLRMAPSQYTANGGGYHYDNYESSSVIDSTTACNTGKRCSDNVIYNYDKDATINTEFYVSFRRSPPNVFIDVSGYPLVRRNCRNNPTNFPQCPGPQNPNYNSFLTNFNLFWIGRTDNYFKGTIDEVRIYNRFLNDSEIAALYASTNKQNRISVN